MNSPLILKLYRHTYNTVGDPNIIGDMFVNDKYFCHTLEDKKRADGVKVKHETAIPTGNYNFIVTWSPTFERKMILIMGVKMFSGIRIHGGNTSKNTSGCVLVAFNTDYKKIWTTAESKLLKLVQEKGGKGTIEIKDSFFSYDRDLKKLNNVS